jgi:RNA polymerase sigma-70 factor (ECF subfamily)
MAVCNTRNTYISYIRKYGNTGEENIEDHEVASSIDSFSNSDERMLVRQVLYMLSEEDRTLILLRDMNGLTYLDIAKIMGYTEGRVKIGLHRARKNFREFYSKECGED